MRPGDRPGTLLPSAEAIALLDERAAAGHEIFGAEGFRMRPDGKREALLELIVDVSGEAAPPVAGGSYRGCARLCH
ncbi:hypothetical protein MZO42_19200 [Sphingomonas psychrotolerans]|uniref:Uncharacterized protein n=1 Tax=Sphingomonas psychrotolerans TaxID=1327635 RepID=A0ABU3NAL1_9SPHN|nr:hypothetical protein [Sphingomonas psychrotolerans]MDT8760832.1 hypothetical protein [Sphingomonas psychrotolerans]